MLREGMQQRQNNKESSQITQEQRRKNFFQRKRFVNYDMNAAAGVNESSDEELNRSPEGNIGPHSNGQSSQKKNNNSNIVEFDEDPVIIGGKAQSQQQQQTVQFPENHPSHHIHHFGGVGQEGADLKRPGNAHKLPPLETKSQAFDMVNPPPVI